MPRALRHVGGGHRASLGCSGWLLVSVVALVALVVDTHNVKV